jgi:hypothetical protein
VTRKEEEEEEEEGLLLTQLQWTFATVDTLNKPNQNLSSEFNLLFDMLTFACNQCRWVE